LDRALPRVDAERFVRIERTPAPVIDRFRVNPYVDYGRSLTPEGGILLTYKDIDDRLRHTLRRLLLWSVATGIEAWVLAHHSPIANDLINALSLAAAGILNWLIVRQPVETYRTIEIRPDCMILDQRDLFWRWHMENGWPAFKPAPDGTFILAGIYGTRQIDYLTIRRFDEADRAPEVLASHFTEAIRQLWQQPH